MSTTHSAVRWAPVLILQRPDLEPGISASFGEHLPGIFDTPSEAMAAAMAAAHSRPGAMGVSAHRVEVER